MSLQKATIIPLIFILSHFFSTLSFAQSGEGEIDRNDLNDLATSSVVPKKTNTETIGNPYIFDRYIQGTITLANGSKTDVLYMNFNVHENRLEYQDNDQIMAIDFGRVTSFEFYDMDKIRLFKKGYSSKGLEPNEFVEVYGSGKASLLIKHEVSLQENMPSYGTATETEEYIDDEVYYIHNDGETSKLRRLKERFVLRELDNTKPVEKYIDQLNLDLSNVDHVAQFINFYNKENS
jgi:hypothetical protein